MLSSSATPSPQPRPTTTAAKSDVEAGDDSAADDKRKNPGNAEFSLRLAYRQRRFRIISFERRLVEISLLLLALSALWLIGCGISFIVYRSSREAYAVAGRNLGERSEVSGSSADAEDSDPSNHTTIVDGIAKWLSFHRLAHACSAHIRGIPLASACFFALGIAYLISGGCPGTTCVRFRSNLFGCLRMAAGVLLAATSLILAELLAFPTYCMYRQYRGANFDSPKFPAASDFAVLMASAVYAVLYSGLYARFAANELAQKLKLLGHTN